MTPLAFVLVSALLVVAITASAIPAHQDDNKKDLVVLQLTDIHLDHSYEDRCRNAKHNAFGSSGCDAPWILVKTSLDKMKKEFPHPDAIMMTGDMAAHHLPDIETVVTAIRNVTQYMTKLWPETPVLPILGNNDVFPDYEPCDVLLSHVANEWKNWLGESHDSFAKNGYYSSTLFDNLTVIALDGNACSVFNPENKEATSQSCSDMLTFLTATLEDVAAANANAIIINHMIPGGNYYDNRFLWTTVATAAFAEIADKFSSEIRFALGGHLHSNAIRYYSKIVSHVGPAISPVFGTNPGFRSMTLDPTSFIMKDFTAWAFDIETANMLAREPGANLGQIADSMWQRLYGFADTFHVPDVTPQSASKMIKTLKSNPGMAFTYGMLMNGNYLEKKYYRLCDIEAISEAEYKTCIAAFVSAESQGSIARDLCSNVICRENSVCILGQCVAPQY